MRDRREIFRLIGGPDSVTWSSFVVVYLLSVVGHFASAGPLTTSFSERFIFISVASIVMFVPLVILRLTLLRSAEHPHPWIAILGFMAAAVTRAVVLSLEFQYFGHGDPPMWAYRIFAAMSSAFVILLLVAIATASVHAHRPTLMRMAALQRDLLETEHATEGVVADRNEAAVARVRAALEAELLALESATSTGVVEALQRTASEVVRPLSHELANVTPIHPIAPAVDDPSVPWQAVLQRLLSGATLRPIPSAVVGALLLTSLGVAFLGWFAPVVIIAAFAAVIIATSSANALLRRIQPRLSFVLRAVTFVIALVLCSLVEGMVIQWVISMRSSGFSTQVGALFFMPVVTALVAVFTSIREQQFETESAIVDSTSELRRRVALLQQAQWFQQKALSRALHGPVQASVVSAALRLDAAAQSGPVPAEVIEEVRAELLAVLDVLGTANPDQLDFVDSMGRLQGTWAGICEIAVIDTAQSHAVLEADAILRSAVVDILTDSVSNAVRHGRAMHVDIAVSVNGDGDLSLRVIDDGQAETAVPGMGLGTRLLDECSLAWQRADSAHGHEVRAVLPVAR